VFKKELGFTEDIESPDGVVYTFPKSIADSSSVELYQFTEALYFHLLEAGQEVVHPEEYKARRYSKDL
jgi:predicted homoserine dehydrogenase-like protein